MATEVLPVKLPPRQEDFCQRYAMSKNATQSYKAAYSTKRLSSAVCSVSGAKLLVNAKVTKRLEQIVKEVTLSVHIKPVMILNEFAAIAFDKDLEVKDRLKALESLAKYTGILEPEKMTQIFMQVNNQNNNKMMINPEDLPVEVLEGIVRKQLENQTIEQEKKDA